MAAIPKYYQIKTDIRQKIEDGQYKVQDLLPSEQSLQEEYGVSRITVRKALDDLCAEGLIYKIQGKGTFVGRPRHREVNINATDISCIMELQAMGYRATRILLNSEVITCTPELAEACELEEGERYFFLERVYSGEDIPITYEKSYFLYQNLSGIEKYDFEKESINQILRERYNFYMGISNRHMFFAEMPDAKVRHLMQLDKGIPLLCLKSRRYREVDKRCIEYCQAYIRTDMMPIGIEF